jgi:dihydroorotate dehydrogenase (fumarate)
MAQQFETAGANGLVLFNRFYQPEIDPESKTAEPTLEFSTPTELRLRLRWIGILRSQSQNESMSVQAVFIQG